MKNLFIIFTILLIGCAPDVGQTWEHKSSNGNDGGDVEILAIKEDWVRFKSTTNGVIVEMKQSEFEAIYNPTCGCGSSDTENDQNPFTNNTGEQNEQEYETSDDIDVL